MVGAAVTTGGAVGAAVCGAAGEAEGLGAVDAPVVFTAGGVVPVDAFVEGAGSLVVAVVALLPVTSAEGVTRA